MRDSPHITNKQHRTMQEEKKYQLTNETIRHYCWTLYRIQALKDFGDIKAGDKGGWVESEDNLSQDGNCWIYDDSKAYGMSYVSENAKILNGSKIYGLACIEGNAVIERRSDICNAAYIKDAKVSNVLIDDNISIIGDFEIKRPRDFYLFKLWSPYNEYVTYLPNYKIFIYDEKSYTKEELAQHDDFGQKNDIILNILNEIIDLCDYYKEAYPY